MKVKAASTSTRYAASTSKRNNNSQIVDVLIREFKDLSVDIFHDISASGKFDSAKSYTMLKSRIDNQVKSGQLNPKDTLTLKSIQAVLSGLEKVKRSKVSTNIETIDDDHKRGSIYLEADAVNKKGDLTDPSELLSGMKKLVINLIGDSEPTAEELEVIIVPDLIWLVTERVTLSAQVIVQTIRSRQPIEDIMMDNMVIYQNILDKFILSVTAETIVDTHTLGRVRQSEALAAEVRDFLDLYMKLTDAELDSVEDKLVILTETEPRDSLEWKALYNRLSGTVYTFKEDIYVDRYSILDENILYGAIAVLIGELTPDDLAEAIQKEVSYLEKVEDEEQLELSMEISRLRLIEELALEHDPEFKFEVTEILIEMLILKDTDTLEEQNDKLNDCLHDYRH